MVRVQFTEPALCCVHSLLLLGLLSRFFVVALKGAKETVETFETGDDIEARYKGKDKWYKGMIAGVNKAAGKAPPTYDILYEDGDTENEVRVPGRSIRRGGHTSSLCGRNQHEVTCCT